MIKDKLIQGDSIEIVKSFDENSVHSIISDIPYGIGYDSWDILHDNKNSAYGGASAAQKRAGKIFNRRGKPLNGWSKADKNISLEYQNWCESWAADWLRVLKPGGSCIIFAGRRYAHRCIVALEDAGFIFKDALAWEKATAPHRAQRVSKIFERRNDTENAQKWQGWRVANLRPLFEPILWFQKPYRLGGTLADNILEECIGAWNEDAITTYNIFNGPKSSNILKVETTADDHGKHHAQKPLALMELLVSLVTIEDQVVLDPFMGSGTTCLAAKRLKRHYVGIDIDPANVEISMERIKFLK